MAEQLLVTGLSASVFQSAGDTADLPNRSQIVVVGAGIVGSSLAYHLARLGQEVLVLDRASVSAGTSWHAAGLIAHGRSTDALTELAAYGVDLYARLQDDTGIEVNFTQAGSLLLARTPGRMDEVADTAAVARRNDVPYALVSPAEIQQLVPLVSTEVLLGGLHQPNDGHVNPGLATLALAAGAHRAGARFVEGVRVTGIRTDAGRVSAVDTERGAVVCDRAVLAAGLWTRDLAAWCGASVPLYPAEHVHVRSNPVPGIDPLMPVVRDLDASLYMRHLNGCVLVGAFEPKGKPFDPRSLPADFAFGEFPADWGHFAPIRGMAEERMPVLRDAGFDRFLNAPESFTPDANFCLGETAEVAGLFVAAGFNSQGIIFAPGAGRALAEWMVAGAPGFDARSVDVQRFHRQQSNRRYLHDRTREGLGRLYAMHWPHLQPYTARSVRRSPLHDRLSAVGACFGEVNGFETANWYAPVGIEPRYEYSYGRQNWFDPAGNEHRAALTAVALADLSGTAKIEFAGPDALAVLQYATTRDCDIPVGRSIRTLFLNGAGGVELEARVLRLEASRFLLLAPTETHTKIRGIFTRDVVGRSASVSDVSTAYAHLALFGPRAAALLERVTSGEVGAAPLAPGEVRELEVGRGWAWCVSPGTVGGPAVELLPPTDTAIDVYDHLVDAGRDLGLVHAGLHAVDSLRVEAGLRRAGLDSGPASNPLIAGFGHLVDLDKAQDFRGKDRLGAATAGPNARRPASIHLLDPARLLRGGEVVVRDGVVVGQVTSAAYGHGIGVACGLALIDRNLATGADYSVDTADGLVAARVVDVGRSEEIESATGLA